MASKKSDEDQGKRSGTSTPEYKHVLEYMESLIRAIEADEHTTKHLCIKFKMATWVDVNVTDPTAEYLLKKALGMIERSPSKYETFFKMLKETTGLQDILPSLGMYI